LNMVEIWFGILTLKSLRGASFTDTEQLGAHIKAFQEAYNETAHPFVWKKREIRGAQLSNSIKNFCNQTLVYRPRISCTLTVLKFELLHPHWDPHPPNAISSDTLLDQH